MNSSWTITSRVLLCLCLMFSNLEFAQSYCTISRGMLATHRSKVLRRCDTMTQNIERKSRTCGNSLTGMCKRTTDDQENDVTDVETPESRTRRAVLSILFGLATAGWAKIQFDPQLTEMEQSLKQVSPEAAKFFSLVVWGDKIRPPSEIQSSRTMRKQLAGSFARDLGECILEAAVSDLKLVDRSKVLKDESNFAMKAIPFFPNAVKPSGDAGRDFANYWDTEELANVALYSRLRTLSPYLPSPLSRKIFREAVADRILQQAILPSFDLPTWLPPITTTTTTANLTPTPTNPTPTTSTTTTTTSDPQAETDRWLGGIAAMLKSYEDCGYAVCDIGDKGIGTLDREAWAEDGRAALTLSFKKVAVITACQALAGESLNDLSAALLPTAVVAAYLRQCGVSCDAEDYYISDTYTRDPAQYRPDGLVVQLNLSAEPRNV